MRTASACVNGLMDSEVAFVNRLSARASEYRDVFPTTQEPRRTKRRGGGHEKAGVKQDGIPATPAGTGQGAKGSGDGNDGIEGRNRNMDLSKSSK